MSKEWITFLLGFLYAGSLHNVQDILDGIHAKLSIRIIAVVVFVVAGYFIVRWIN